MLRKLTGITLLLVGLYTAGLALWQLGRTAAFVHEAVYIPAVVVDGKERPFDSVLEQLRHGNLPWQGDTAYQPYVRYTLFGLQRTDATLPDLDNREYANGEQVEIILHPQETHRRHINRFKFLWGGHLMQLALGVLLTIASRRLFLRRKQRTHAHTPCPASSPPIPPASSRESDTSATAPSAPRKRRRKTTASAPAEKKAKTPAKRRRKKTDS